MPIFTYSAAKRNGEIVKGEKEAQDEKTLAAALRTEELMLLEAREKRGFSLAAFNVNLGELFSRLKPIGLVDKMFFARNLAVMIGAGLSLTKSLEVLAQESPHPRFRKIVHNVNEGVLKGKSLAESLRAHEQVFGELFINMVEVGETAGKLTLVLTILAKQMKKDHTLRRRVKGAMFYPAIIMIALLGIGALMMIYVVPTLSQTIRELGVEIPWTTQLIITISDLMINYSHWVLIGAIALLFFFWRALKTKRGKKIFDRIILKFPIFGSLVQKFNIARFCRILSYLIVAGVPIVRSLEITAGVLSNTLFRSAIQEAAGEIQKGKQLNQILTSHASIFPPLVLQMISVGEETGKISSMLLRLALFFEEDVDSTTRNLSTIIEPILMIVIGIVVGFFAISMLQPIYSSLGNIG